MKYISLEQAQRDFPGNRLTLTRDMLMGTSLSHPTVTRKCQLVIMQQFEGLHISYEEFRQTFRA